VVNFWLPIPFGGVSYLSLRFESLGWRQRLSSARDEIVEHPSRASLNSTKPTEPPSARPVDATVEGPAVNPPMADTSTPRPKDDAPKIRPFSKPGDAATG
jgi:hypothetical protein